MSGNGTVDEPTKPRRRSRLTPQEERELAPQRGIDWREWWRAFGRQHRQVREFLGFSQEQVARLAGVSQGAVSRLEAGRGLGTPMLVIVKVGLVIRRALAGLDPNMLSQELRQFLELENRLSPPVGDMGFEALPLTSDPALQDLVRLYRALPERNRQTFVSIVRAVAGALSSGSAEKG
jgi:transcriptional regulator with XRE-family HTH domain